MGSFIRPAFPGQARRAEDNCDLRMVPCPSPTLLSPQTIKDDFFFPSCVEDHSGIERKRSFLKSAGFGGRILGYEP